MALWVVFYSIQYACIPIPDVLRCSPQLRRDHPGRDPRAPPHGRLPARRAQVPRAHTDGYQARAHVRYY